MCIRDSLIDRSTGTIKDSSKHILRNSNLQVLAGELNTGLFDIDTGSTFENLDNSLRSSDFQNLPLSDGAVWQSQVDNLVVTGKLDIVQNHQGPIDTSNGVVLDSGLDFEPLGDGSFVQLEQFLVSERHGCKCSGKCGKK